MNRLLSFALAASLAVLPLFGHAADPVADGAAAAPAPSLPAITVSPVETRLLRDRVVGSGLVVAVDRVQVHPLIEGQPIETLEVDVGDTVTEGQVLARLSKSTLRLQESQFAAQRASAEASIAQAEAQLLEAEAASDEATRVNERTQQLRAQGSSSQAAADTARSTAISAAAGVQAANQRLVAARAQLDLVDAQIQDLQLQLSRTDVVAPVAGQVIERNALVGSVATASAEPMFVIVRDNAVELRAQVAERFIAKLQPGQPVVMQGVGLPDPLTGTVRLVAPSIDLQTRLGEVRIAIEQSDLVRSGMFLDAQILAAERETASVPVSAIATGTEGVAVMRVVDGLVERVPVELGIREAGYVEILSGVAAGDLVVTKAAAFVRDGDKINPVPAPVGTN